MQAKKRLLSLDIFRGITIMLMILVNTPGSFEHIYPLLRHAPWTGCTLADLVFPFFLFSVGYSAFLSCQNHCRYPNAALYKKIIWRSARLFVLGILFNMYPYYDYTKILSWHNLLLFWSHIRIFGILQRIACAYLTGLLLCLALQSRKRILLAGGLLLFLSWLGLNLYHPAAPYALNDNLSRTIDLWFPGAAHIYQGFGIPFDPEGLYGTLTAAVSVMLGYVSGQTASHTKDILPVPICRLSCLGTGSIFCGLLLSLSIPLCKALWTPSYVLFTSGAAMLIFSGLLYLVDLKHCALPLLRPARAFGTNPLFFFFFSAFLAQSLSFPWITIQGLPLFPWIYQYGFQYRNNPALGSLLFSIVYLFLCGIPADLLFRKHRLWKI